MYPIKNVMLFENDDLRFCAGSEFKWYIFKKLVSATVFQKKSSENNFLGLSPRTFDVLKKKLYHYKFNSNTNL